MSDDIVILIPAAGSSSRMRGPDKLLEPVGGEPLLRRQARLARETGYSVVVTLPPDRPKRAAALTGLDVTTVTVADAASGMAASLRAGVDRTRTIWPEAAGLMILPADMPDFTIDALRLALASFRNNSTRIVRGATGTGHPGHPAIFPRDLWDALAGATGDRGGRLVLAAHPLRVLAVTLPGRMAITDLDTPEDWAAWRASGGVA